MAPAYSTHALKRMQQRGISEEVVEVILACGRRTYSKGGVSYSMNKQARARAERLMGPEAFSSIADHLGCYVIVSLDGTTITTVAWRLRHNRR